MPAPNVTKTANHNFNVSLPNGEVIPLGQSTSSFTPKMVFPRWQSYAWNASIGLSMAVPANALAIAGMTSSNTANSVTADNSYFTITYSGVDVNPGYNEGGGLDISITLKRSIGNTLAFSFNNVNTKAYLQPSLTLEWSIGQDLGGGVTVASVTDTDVTGTDGQNYVHRPDYVVNAIAFYHATQGGLVSDVQVATGLTTGQIGMLYRMKVTDSSATPKTGWANWSIRDANTLWLNFDTTGMTYPIMITPAGDTFGYTTAGASNVSAGSNQVLFDFGGFSGAAGTGTSISCDCYRIVGTNTYQGAIYTLSGGTYSLFTKGSTGDSATLATSPAWVTTNFSSAPTFTATTYYILVNFSGTANGIAYTSNGNTIKSKAMTYGTWGSFSSPTTYNGGEASIYCTYTAGGGTSNYTKTTLFTIGTKQLNASRLSTLTRKATFQIHATSTGRKLSASIRKIAFTIKANSLTKKAVGKSVKFTIGITPTLKKLSAVTRKTLFTIGTKSLYKKGVGKSTKFTIGVTSTGKRLSAVIRKAAFTLKATSIGSKIYSGAGNAYIKTVKFTIGVASTAKRSVTLTRKTLFGIGISLSGSRQTALKRTTRFTMGVTSLPSKLVSRIRKASFSIGVSSTGKKQSVFLRSARFTIGVQSTASRTSAIIRKALFTIGVSSSGYKGYVPFLSVITKPIKLVGQKILNLIGIHNQPKAFPYTFPINFGESEAKTVNLKGQKPPTLPGEEPVTLKGKNKDDINLKGE